MAFLKLLAAATLLLGSGCVGAAVNKASIYPAVSGVVDLAVTVPLSETISKVQFQIDNELVHEDTDPSDGFSAQIDTTGFASGKLYKLSAVGVRADGSIVVLKENYIYVRVSGAAGTSGAGN